LLQKLNIFPLYATLSLRYNPTNDGIIKGIKNVPTLRKLSANNFVEKNIPYQKCVEKTHEMLIHNISKIKSKKIVIGLSGGTDSSLNTLLVSKFDKFSLKCFCVGFDDELDEFDDALTVAKLANCDYKEYVINDVLKDLPQLIWKFKAPKSYLWPYYNFKIVQELGAKTTVSGEGGDELFGGYFFRYQNYLKFTPKTPENRAARYLKLRSRDWIPNLNSIFGKQIKETKYNFSSLAKFFVSPFTNKLPYISQIFLADFNFKLRYDYNFVDSVFAKTEKIRLESPFLDSNIITFATHIPINYKISKKTSKMILRDILKQIGAPEKIYNKTKQGWGMKPMTVWKRSLEDRTERFLLNGCLVRDGWINKEWIKNTISLIQKKKNDQVIFPYINKLWDLLSFEIFYIQKILRESKKGKISEW